MNDKLLFEENLVVRSVGMTETGEFIYDKKARIGFADGSVNFMLLKVLPVLHIASWVKRHILLGLTTDIWGCVICLVRTYK